MKNPRIILWDELPGAIKQEFAASWEKSPLIADGYQSEAKTESASFQAFCSLLNQETLSPTVYDQWLKH